MYGFKERRHAEVLKEIAESRISAGVSSSMELPVTGNGPRIFLISLPKAIPAFQDGLPGAGEGEIRYLQNLSELSEDGTDETDEEMKFYQYEEDQENVKWKVRNLTGSPIPATSDPSRPEELHMAVQDSFGTLYLIPEVSEIFGTLQSDWSTGDENEQVIELSKGFERSETFTAFPAPTLSENLTAGTPVTCRFIKAVGKWFFFRPSGGGGNAAEVNASGTALEGMGKHEDGLEIWASQLAAGSETVHTYRTPAVRTKVKAVGSDDDSPWIRFPTIMTDDPEGVTYVRGSLYHANGKIWEKKYFGTVYADDSGTLYFPTFQTFNGSPTWKSADQWIYLTDGKWMKAGSLGTLPDDPQIEPNGNFGAWTIEELGLFLYEKPCWECEDTYGIYLPKEGTPAEGEILFGVPMFQIDDDSGPVPYGGSFTRTLKKEFQKEMSAYFWKYTGELGLYSEDETELLKYSDIAYRKTITGEWKWILGAYGHTENGWFELDEEPDPNRETDQELDFCVVEKYDKQFTPADLIRNRFSETIEERENEFRIRDSKTACWKLSKEKTADVSFTFPFQFSEDAEVPEIQEDRTISLDDLLRKDPELPNIFPDDDAGTFLIGQKGDPAGWHEAPQSDFEKTFTFLHGPAVSRDLFLQFKAWTEGEFTENIWKTEPEIVT